MFLFLCMFVCYCAEHTHIHTHLVSDGWIDGWRGKEWDLWVSLSHSWWNAENDAEEFRRQKTLSVCVSPFSGRARKPLCPRAAAGLVTLLLISEVTADWEASARMQKFLRLCRRFLRPCSCWSVSVTRAEIVKLWLCQMRTSLKSPHGLINLKIWSGAVSLSFTSRDIII